VWLAPPHSGDCFEAETPLCTPCAGWTSPCRRSVRGHHGPIGLRLVHSPQLLAGLDTADEDAIVVAGGQVTGRSEDHLSRMRRNHIGIVFQFSNLLRA
jgi:hypothetical protein